MSFRAKSRNLHAIQHRKEIVTLHGDSSAPAVARNDIIGINEANPTIYAHSSLYKWLQNFGKSTGRKTMDNQTKQVQAHVFISGRVQGVSFRWYTQQYAQQVGLTGWVRNVWDGRVEAIFEGPEPVVRQAITWCHHGEPPAQVENVEVTYKAPTDEFKGFRITW